MFSTLPEETQHRCLNHCVTVQQLRQFLPVARAFRAIVIHPNAWQAHRIDLHELNVPRTFWFQYMYILRAACGVVVTRQQSSYAAQLHRPLWTIWKAYPPFQHHGRVVAFRAPYEPVIFMSDSPVDRKVAFRVTWTGNIGRIRVGLTNAPSIPLITQVRNSQNRNGTFACFGAGVAIEPLALIYGTGHHQWTINNAQVRHQPLGDLNRHNDIRRVSGRNALDFELVWSTSQIRLHLDGVEVSRCNFGPGWGTRYVEAYSWLWGEFALISRFGATIAIHPVPMKAGPGGLRTRDAHCFVCPGPYPNAATSVCRHCARLCCRHDERRCSCAWVGCERCHENHRATEHCLRRLS